MFGSQVPNLKPHCVRARDVIRRYPSPAADIMRAASSERAKAWSTAVVTGQRERFQQQGQFRLERRRPPARPHKPARYSRVILPLTALRRLDCVLEPASEALTKPGIVGTLCDPAAGTGAMLALAEDYLRELKPPPRLECCGQQYVNPAVRSTR
jgi:hypothetical protein